MARLSDPITILKGIGPTKARQFANLNIFTLRDLICHFPRGYEDRTKLVPVIAFAFLAELFRTDYGAWGVGMIALFVLTRERKDRNMIQTLMLAAICYLMNSASVPIFGIRVPIELFAVLALIPIFLYTGKKSTGSKAVQTMFYLFYPVHLLVLYMITLL